MICCIVGARPNFVKMAPVVQALAVNGAAPFLIHTGQHYDAAMSAVFFEQLGMPRPARDLGVGGGSHAAQTAAVMTALERELESVQPELVVVAGDVNSTLAAALVAAKLQIPLAHVEAGLRSFDRTMPEEVNRVLTDHVADLLFTTEASGEENLRREGIPEDKIFFVGNCMIDTLDRHLAAAVESAPWKAFGLEAGAYGVVTLHRPANVDHPERLKGIVGALGQVSQRLPLVFAVHPRTASQLGGALEAYPGIRATGPLGYLEFLGLTARARLVLTDSGGLQEEACALGVPCLTLRENTERPVTLEGGRNVLVGSDPARIVSAAEERLNDPSFANRHGEVVRPPLWDGHAGERIARVIQAWLGGG